MRGFDLARLVSVTPRVDGIEFAVEDRQKVSGCTCANPLKPWTVANVRARVPDPAKGRRLAASNRCADAA